MKPAPDALPRHIAFIMDGNGRWAKARGLPRPRGHIAGAETVRRVIAHTRELGIPYLTLYAFSTENWSRPQDEVDALMRLLADFIESETPNMVDNGIKLKILGDTEKLPGDLGRRLAHAVRATGGGRTLTLALAVNYGGRDEIVRAARTVLRQFMREGRDPGELDAKTLAAGLDTAGIPPPDLLIRTAGEMRLSNFLIWQAAYAELLFLPVAWPDFSETEYDGALAEYAKRVRTFGGAT